MALAANLLSPSAAPRRSPASRPAVSRADAPPRPEAPLVLHLAPASRELVRECSCGSSSPRSRPRRPRPTGTRRSVSSMRRTRGDRPARRGFTGDPRTQVTNGYAGHGGGALFAVTDGTALLAIEKIVEQGEGSTRRRSRRWPPPHHPTPPPNCEPFGFEGAPKPGDYWRFLEIAEGSTPLGEVHPMRVDPTTGDLPEGDLYDLSRLFDAAFSLQLQVMEHAWGAGTTAH